MPDYSREYVYHLTIHNRTAYDLNVESRLLTYGVWFRNEVDYLDPVAVPAGTTLEALGIRAASDVRKGYACRCTWKLNMDANASMTLSISIPFISGKNRAGLDVAGACTITGWTGVSTLGHRFAHTLVVHSA